MQVKIFIRRSDYPLPGFVFDRQKNHYIPDPELEKRKIVHGRVGVRCGS